MNEEVMLILKANQLILRDRRWQYGENSEKAKVIDQQITELLNVQKEDFAKRTDDALGIDHVEWGGL